MKKLIPIFFIIVAFSNVSFAEDMQKNDRTDCIKQNAKTCFKSDGCNAEPLSFGQKRLVKSCKDEGGETGECIVKSGDFDDNTKACLSACFDKICPINN